MIRAAPSKKKIVHYSTFENNYKNYCGSIVVRGEFRTNYISGVTCKDCLLELARNTKAGVIPERVENIENTF